MKAGTRTATRVGPMVATKFSCFISDHGLQKDLQQRVNIRTDDSGTSWRNGMLTSVLGQLIQRASCCRLAYTTMKSAITSPARICRFPRTTFQPKCKWSDRSPTSTFCCLSYGLSRPNDPRRSTRLWPRGEQPNNQTQQLSNFKYRCDAAPHAASMHSEGPRCLRGESSKCSS